MNNRYHIKFAKVKNIFPQKGFITFGADDDRNGITKKIEAIFLWGSNLVEQDKSCKKNQRNQH